MKPMTVILLSLLLDLAISSTLPKKQGGKQQSIASIKKYFAANNLEKCESPCFISDGSGCLCPISRETNRFKSSYVIGRNNFSASTKQQQNSKCIKCSLEEINFCKNDCLFSDNQNPTLELAFCHYNCFIKLCIKN